MKSVLCAQPANGPNLQGQNSSRRKKPLDKEHRGPSTRPWMMHAVCPTPPQPPASLHLPRSPQIPLTPPFSRTNTLAPLIHYSTAWSHALMILSAMHPPFLEGPLDVLMHLFRERLAPQLGEVVPRRDLPDVRVCAIGRISNEVCVQGK
jgi:hypothetical protein